MPEAVLKRLEFQAIVTKVWKDSSTGKHFLKAIASDTGVDYHGERFTENALNKMVDNINKGNPEPVILLPTHWDTFEIGKAVEGSVIQSPTHKDLKALEVTFELDMEYPQAKSLYNEVESGNAQKQLSVGGYLNPDNNQAYFWETKEYETEDGNHLWDWILALDDMVLDHVAVTRKDQAANPRTAFLGTVAKSLNIEKPSRPANPSTVTTKGVEEMPDVVDQKTQSFMNMIGKSVRDFFKSTDESDVKKEAAKKAIETAALALKDLSSGDALEGAEVTDLFGPFYQEFQYLFTQPAEEYTEADTNPAETTAAIVSDNGAAGTVSDDDDGDGTKVNRFDTEKALKDLVPQITSSVSKALEEKQTATFQEICKTLGTVLGEEISKAVTPLNEKISKLEKSAGSKSIQGQEGLTNKNSQDSTNPEDSESVWKGFFTSAIPSHVVAERTVEQE